MAVSTIQPFTFLTTHTTEDSRSYTSYKQNIVASTAFITSKQAENGQYVLVRASSIDDNRQFLNSLLKKHSEVRDQIAYILFAVREIIPGFTSSTLVKAKYQHGLSCLPKFSAAHACLTPHIIDNLYPCAVQNVCKDLYQTGKISEKTTHEIALLMTDKEEKNLPKIISGLEKAGEEINWPNEFAQKKAISKDCSTLQKKFALWLDDVKLKVSKDTQPFFIKAGQLNLLVQKIGKPSYPGIQESATPSESIKNIDLAIEFIDSWEKESIRQPSENFLQELRNSLTDLRRQITSSVFYRLETFLKPYERESIISVSSIVYQNMNITTEFPQYINAIVDSALELEFRDYCVYLQNEVSLGKISSLEAFTIYCERKNKFLRELAQTFQKQGQALEQIYAHLEKLQALGKSLKETDPKDFQSNFVIISHMRAEWESIRKLKPSYSPSQNRAFGALNIQIKEVVDPSNLFQDSFEKTEHFLKFTIHSARLNIVEGGHIRQILDSVMRCFPNRNGNAQSAFEKLLVSYKTDAEKIKSFPVPVIKEFLFDFFDYFCDRFHQRQHFEAVKNNELRLRQFISDLMQIPTEDSPFSQSHDQTCSTPYLHNSLLARKLINEKKDFDTYSFEQLRDFMQNYFQCIYESEFQAEKDLFKEVLSDIRKLKKDRETRLEFEEIRQRFGNSYASPTPFEKIMQETGIVNFATAPKLNMLSFLDKLSAHLKQHPEQVVFIRDSIANAIYQQMLRFAETPFDMGSWEKVIDLVKNCQEAAEAQATGSLEPSDVPALEKHFFDDPERTREEVIQDIALKQSYVFLEPVNALLNIAVNPHAIDLPIKATVIGNSSSHVYSVIETDPPGYHTHPSLHHILKQNLPIETGNSPKIISIVI